MLSIQSERLRAEIACPGEAPNTATRFDRAGFVTEIVLDGIHRFCASEPNNLSHPSSGGRGLCNEYIFDPSAEADIGDSFPKPGIGLLKKETPEPYYFARAYDTTQLYPITVQTEESCVTFHTKQIECLGYSLEQIKKVEVSGNTLSISVSLENTGRLSFESSEYCHNFLTINGMAIGPDYRLDFEDVRNLGPGTADGLLSLSGKSITIPHYNSVSDGEIFPPDKLIRGDAFRWSLINSAAGARINVQDEIDICKLIVWAADHMISVESFHQISLKPGETDTWKRTWTFENLLN